MSVSPSARKQEQETTANSATLAASNRFHFVFNFKDKKNYKLYFTGFPIVHRNYFRKQRI